MRIRGAALSLMVGLLLAGCSGSPTQQPSTPAEQVYGSSPPNSYALTPGPGARAGWDQTGTRIALVTLGSSTCPNRPKQIVVTSPTQISVTFYRQRTGPCSADISPTTAIITPAATISRTAPLDIELGTYGRVVLPPIKQ